MLSPLKTMFLASKSTGCWFVSLKDSKNLYRKFIKDFFFMPFQSFLMGIIVFIFRKIDFHPIHIQYREFICTRLFCFWVHKNLELIRYGNHSNIKSPMSSSRKRYPISRIIRPFLASWDNMRGLCFC